MGICDAETGFLYRLVMCDEANFTSPGKPINKISDTGTMSNHAEFSKSLHAFRKPRFFVECRL